ncbi:MAG TPA: SRPBCC family protein [Kofleriaceae bacterium]|nr:SRPBCC family protein [Kofleriaceae bacterium]
MESQQAFSRRDPGQLSALPDGSKLSRALGLFSLGLGLTEIAALRALARAIGVKPDGRTSTALRVLGMREILSGIGVLLKPRRSLPLWARVAGDAIDLGAMAWAARSRRTSMQRLGAAFVAVAGVAALDVIASRRVARAHRTAIDPVIASVTINKPVSEVYAFWRRLENLPRFMDFLESVSQRPSGRSRWVARLPLGRTIAWDAEIIDDRPDELIAWRTVEGSTLQHRGEVSFARTPGRDMTEVRIQLELGLFGARPNPVLAKLLTRPQIKGDLRRLKQVMETGEVVRSDASIHRGRHPAQPPVRAPAGKGPVP